jgi:hypothetical protein
MLSRGTRYVDVIKQNKSIAQMYRELEISKSQKPYKIRNFKVIGFAIIVIRLRSF